MANLDRHRVSDGLARGFKFRLGGPVTPIEDYPTTRTRSCSGMTNALADRVVIDEGLACPVDADRTKEAMLNGVPLGRTGRIVSHPDTQARLVRDLLEPALPIVSFDSVGASGISKDQQLRCRGVQSSADATPPRMDGICSEGWRIMRCSDDDEAIATRHIVDAVGNRYAIGITRKVVHLNVDRRLAPLPTLILERSDQFALLGINADDRLPALRERVLEPIDICELPVSVR